MISRLALKLYVLSFTCVALMLVTSSCTTHKTVVNKYDDPKPTVIEKERVIEKPAPDVVVVPR